MARETPQTSPLIEVAYAQLKHKFRSLPDYDSLNYHFEISTVPLNEFLIRNIKRKQAETLEPILDFLEHMIFPDPNSFTDFYESRCFTDDEKKKLVHLYRHLMELYRAILETNLEGDSTKDAKLIRAIHDKWIEDKKHILPFMSKLRQFWHKHVEPKEMLEYLG